MALSVGSPAPDFTLKTMTADGLKDVTLSDNFGKKNTVLLFFPGTFTTPCTTEMCDVTSGLSAWTGLDAEVYGISVDTPFSQAGWAKANAITVTLLSDFSRRTVQAYDVESPDFAGLGNSVAKRAVFVIDKAGVVRYVEVTPELGVQPDFAKAQAALGAL